MHTRIEKAIKTAPMEEQTKVWDAFNADQGFGENEDKDGWLGGDARSQRDPSLTLGIADKADC
jgi:hypothetical protein